MRLPQRLYAPEWSDAPSIHKRLEVGDSRMTMATDARACAACVCSADLSGRAAADARLSRSDLDDPAERPAQSVLPGVLALFRVDLAKGLGKGSTRALFD